PMLQRLIVLSDRRHAADTPSTSWAEFIAAGAAIDDAQLDARLARLGSQDIADVMFTSGTTGLPKGALFNHERTLLAARILTQATGLNASDRYMPFGPFSHTAGYKGGWLASLLAGAIIYAGNVVNARMIMQLVSAERLTRMSLPPTVLQEILA